MRSATHSSAEQKDPSVLHRNAPLSVEGRRRLVQRCRTRPIAHVAAEMGISRQCASKWVNRYRRFGEAGLLDHPSVPRGRLRLLAPTSDDRDVAEVSVTLAPQALAAELCTIYDDLWDDVCPNR